jgi:hypothetical protein
MAKRGKELFREQFTIEATALPVREWAQTPRRAPDAREPVRLRFTAPPHPDRTENACGISEALRRALKKIPGARGRFGLRRGEKPN